MELILSDSEGPSGKRREELAETERYFYCSLNFNMIPQTACDDALSDFDASSIRLFSQ